ncbi:peptide chain release factor N(5)-glutamine methyltransferase [Bacteroidota bacterium]
MNKLKSGSSLAEGTQFIRECIKEKYSPEEITSFINLIFNHLLNYSKIEIQLNKNIVLEQGIISSIIKIVEELDNYRPIQYILGYTEFYGVKILLDNSVLIPRPETEELVDWIIKNNKGPVSILDAGTGSGCIAIALAKNIIEAEITATDLSDKALKMAGYNAVFHDLNINFIKSDILNMPENLLSMKFNIIVSNPPYICMREKKMMRKNVLIYEPGEALFVSDKNPLIYYSALINYAYNNLTNKGKIYFEINEAYGQEVVKLLDNSGFKNIELKKDINEKDRMVKGELV